MSLVYFTVSAQRPTKQIKMDFYLMHSTNCSVFFPPLLSVPWLSPAQKCRLLEWKVRLDLALYLSRRSPELRMEEVKNYVPKMDGGDGSAWEGLYKRINVYEDDGHAAKFVRALANGEKVCGKYENGGGPLAEKFRVKGQDWLKMGNMGMSYFVPYLAALVTGE